MLEYMLDFFQSWFVVPGLSWYHALIAIGLAFAFGAAWFAPYWTPILRKPWAWAILAVSAFLTLLAVTFVQIPLQWWTGDVINNSFSQQVILDWLLLLGIPTILLTGLVQEGAKLVPVVFYWQRKGRRIDPKMGLIIGAVAGLGFGVFEAVWVHNNLFAIYGWNWGMVTDGGFAALAEFWSRFFAVAFHIAASALAGYGLAKGWGWQFYLIASGLHALLNYSLVLASFGLFGTVGLEIYVAVGAVLVTAVALWLRWRKTAEPTPGEVSPPQTPDAEPA
jgi:RsiW-degrading membrane proteinase PrsW (M82 family)